MKHQAQEIAPSQTSQNDQKSGNERKQDPNKHIDLITHLLLAAKVPDLNGDPKKCQGRDARDEEYRGDEKAISHSRGASGAWEDHGSRVDMGEGRGFEFLLYAGRETS